MSCDCLFVLTYLIFFSDSCASGKNNFAQDNLLTYKLFFLCAKKSRIEGLMDIYLVFFELGYKVKRSP